MFKAKIDFRQIAARSGDQAAAFEEFCCQIARHTPSLPVGSEFVRFRGAGGDGGVECIWRLPNGDEWGWQAKFLFELTKAKAALDESVTTALLLHPRLVKYTICLPFDLTGPTARKGKSQTERFDEYRSAWEVEAHSQGMEMQICLSTATTLLDDLFSFDPNHGRLRFWFDATILGDEWFTNHLAEAKASAYPRYTPELTIETPLGEALESFGQTEEWFASLAPRLKAFRELLNDWEESVASTQDDVYAAVFPEKARPLGQQLQESLRSICDSYQQIADPHESPVDIVMLTKQVRAAADLLREIRAALAADLDEQHGKDAWKSKGFRQFMAEYQLSFPTANVDKADEILKFLDDFVRWVSSAPARVSGAAGLLVLGVAGAGKTHGICDNADKRAVRDLKTIVLFGERFSGTADPWESIRQQLGLDASFGREEMLAALDASGEATGKPLLFYLDGVNETKPRSYWPAHLPAMVAQFGRYESLRLCISCRTTYQSQVIPTTLDLPMVEHLGFAGIEFNACRDFFAHYELEPPVGPILQPEFSNPLFLRLICEAVVDAGRKQLPLGWHGISSAISALINAKNQRYATEHDSHPSHRYPERALKAIVSAAEKVRTSSLPWTTADSAIGVGVPGSETGSTLLDWLVREGLLIVDAEINPASAATEDHVRLAFERLGDHLLADQLLARLEANNIASAFANDGQLDFLVQDLDAVNEHRGLWEALSIQIPERFGLEIPNLVSSSSLRTELTKVLVAALPWRDPDHITLVTSQLLRGSLSFRGHGSTTLDVCLAVCVRPSAVDALWFHALLAERAMADRDGYWCGYLHTSYEEGGPVKNLLRSAFEIEPAAIPYETAERWATILLWFCAAADRRVRDYSTKALVRITERIPHVWLTLIKRFITCDDDYVVERCLLAAYGTLLRARNPEAEGLVADLVFQEVFKNSKRFQNALIRDHARSIIELAHHDNVLAKDIVNSAFLPPYESEWPIVIPTVEQLEPYRNSRNEMPKLYASVTDDDFFVYTLAGMNPYIETVDRQSMARWIFQHVLELGYPGKQLANYDGYMLYQFGGGRGRPTWAERIGKKYQWISLARLAARLSDNVKPKADDWYPEPLRPPLVYESGRDIDPSLLIRNSALERKAEAWWISQRYDFQKTSSMKHEEWVKVHDDVPDTASLLSERPDAQGRHWTILESYPEWTSRTPDMSSSQPYRLIWLQLRSYLLPAKDSHKCWKWLQKQNFFGRWMPEGAELHDGFIGEYPYATTVNLYEDRYLSRGGTGDKETPFEFYPTANSLSVNYEEDAYQDGNIRILVPARRFFELESLSWDGTSGYHTSSGVLRFLDPSILEAGPSTLLIEADFLRQFITKHKLVIVWTVIGEKLRITEESGSRLVYSRAHMLTARGLKSSTPVITDD